MKIIHVSDRHFGQPDAAARNQRLNSAIMARPDIHKCVIIDTGDTADTPTRAEVETALTINGPLEKAARDYLCVRGNHDVKRLGFLPGSEQKALAASYIKRLTGHAGNRWPQLHEYRDGQGGGVAVILADSCQRREGMAGFTSLATGWLGAEQIGSIAAVTADVRRRGLRSVLAMHHCPSGGSPSLRLADRADLATALDAVGRVDVMLCGHLHQRNVWSGVFGAGLLVSSPKSQDAGGYHVIDFPEDGLASVEWVEIP